jgi:hypothetical protein
LPYVNYYNNLFIKATTINLPIGIYEKGFTNFKSIPTGGVQGAGVQGAGVRG